MKISVNYLLQEGETTPNTETLRLQEYTILLHVVSEAVENMPDWMSNLSPKLKYKIRRLEESMNAGVTD